MTKKEIIILGGGISGLSLAWYLKKYSPESSITILEKSSRVGGVIGHNHGPKTIRVSSGESILDLIEELQLQDQLIYSSEESAKRYLYYKNKIQLIPKDPIGFLTSPLTRKALFSIIKEPFIKKGPVEDETIGAFMRRRFGNYIADVFVEPFIAGICGGDMHKLSMQAYFPTLKQKEQESGSIVKAMLKRDKKKKKSSSLFNVKGGLVTLTEKLGEILKECIFLNQEVKEVRKSHNKVEVITDQGIFIGDHVFSALSLAGIKKIKLPFEQEKFSFFHDFKSASLASISLSYKEDVLPMRGFGYLVPSEEKQKILGVLFDSEIFPSLEEYACKTRLTVMMGGALHPGILQRSDEELIHTALDTLFAHMGIYANPVSKEVFRYEDAIPQYSLYHKERFDQLKKQIKTVCPYFTLAGSYLDQAAVYSCVNVSKEIAKEYTQC